MLSEHEIIVFGGVVVTPARIDRRSGHGRVDRPVRHSLAHHGETRRIGGIRFKGPELPLICGIVLRGLAVGPQTSDSGTVRRNQRRSVAHQLDTAVTTVGIMARTGHQTVIRAGLRIDQFGRFRRILHIVSAVCVTGQIQHLGVGVETRLEIIEILAGIRSPSGLGYGYHARQ